MAGAIMDKVWGLFGMEQPEQQETEDEDVYEYDDKAYDYDNNAEEEDKKFFGKKGKVFKLHLFKLSSYFSG